MGKEGVPSNLGRTLAHVGEQLGRVGNCEGWCDQAALNLVDQIDMDMSLVMEVDVSFWCLCKAWG